MRVTANAAHVAGIWLKHTKPVRQARASSTHLARTGGLGPAARRGSLPTRSFARVQEKDRSAAGQPPLRARVHRARAEAASGPWRDGVGAAPSGAAPASPPVATRSAGGLGGREEGVGH